MTCSGYIPPFQKQLDGTRLGGSNCTCASAAMAVADDTCGKQNPSPSQVRTWTGDTSGGTNLAQMYEALHDHTATILEVRYRLPWSEFMRKLQTGRGAILQGGYSAIADSRFDAGRGFRGNHAIYVNPNLIAMDPLADGRYGEAYKYHGERYPESLLRVFAGRLNLEGRAGYPAKLLGDGLCYAAFTRDNDTTWVAHAGKATTFDRFFVSAGRITGYERRVTANGWTLPCTVPQMILRRTVNERVALVRLTKPGSSMDQWWVSARLATEYP